MWTYATQDEAYPDVLYHLYDGNETAKAKSWKPTHLIKWFQFWKGVRGDRVAIHTADPDIPDIQLEAFLENDHNPQ